MTGGKAWNPSKHGSPSGLQWDAELMEDLELWQGDSNDVGPQGKHVELTTVR